MLVGLSMVPPGTRAAAVANSPTSSAVLFALGVLFARPASIPPGFVAFVRVLCVFGTSFSKGGNLFAAGVLGLGLLASYGHSSHEGAGAVPRPLEIVIRVSIAMYK